MQETDTEIIRLKQEISQIDQALGLQEAEIKRVGGSFADRRDEYKTAQIRLEAEIEQLEEALRDLCAGLLPFAIVPDMTAILKKQLLLEGAYQRWEASREFIEQKLDDIAAEVQQPSFWTGTGAELLFDLQKAISERVTVTLQRTVQPPDEIKQTELRHLVAPLEQRQLLGWIEESRTVVPQQLRDVTRRLARCRREQQENEAALKRVPSDDVLAPLMEKLNALNQNKGAVQSRQSQAENEQNRLKRQKEDLLRKLHRAKEKRAAYRKLSGRVQQIVDVELSLDDFTERLMRLRVNQLQTAFMENFNRLCRKERLIESVAIDPHDFTITLYRDGQQATPKTDLSAGEKQIYAISMLWALKQVSGRPLPMIIDTPLGRLDRDHRRNLVERYFPRASHQMIIFSTDTEVDANFFAELESGIAHAYHLEHDDRCQATTVSRGYFWI